MKRFITFGSIDQFRTVIKNIQYEAQYVGFREGTQEVIVNRDAKMPIITVTGSEKIHGTNASVCYSHSDGFWVQSRKNIIVPEKDNAGCAFAAYNNTSQWLEIISSLRDEYNIDLDTHIISIYFEWAGGNIQKNSALTGLDKRSMIFQYFKVSPIDPQLDKAGVEMAAVWKETFIKLGNMSGNSDSSISKKYVDFKEFDIFNIMNFPTVSVKIDFNQPLMLQNKMIELVEILEKNSLVGKEFSVDGNIGEGYVFTFEYNNNIHRFKIKGEAHSKGTGKVKTLKPVDEEFENKKRIFVNNIACTESRLDQMFTEITHTAYNGDATLISIKDMGQYIRLVINDIIKEESGRMSEQNLEPKVVNSMIAKVARIYFKDRLDSIF